ncbi:Protein PLASTID MOVEMENT IMPAIRED 2 [Glycine soja]|uniref:Protein PLASTID MOVEMENT IMPAIRED 2 n=1 Tax=Glycine soja TaxID=3848 RepID=A0A0B2SDV4_GLYSO|nr:Protein PLASTID MOVEMENT IMPAIRED 2 [Glycine soja]
MASLDVIRNELKHVTVETDRLKKKKGKVDSTVQNLNFKILRAKSKLEPVSAAEEKARSIVMSLSHTLEKLKTKIEEAKKENEDVSQEVVRQELEVGKASEALALEKLKTLKETRHIKLNGTITPARGAKFQKTASPAARHISPFTIKKRKKVIPNLTKLFWG